MSVRDSRRDCSSPEKLAAILSYQRQHAGETRRVKFRHFEAALFGRPVSHESIEALSRRYTHLVHDAFLRCALIPGARELLDAARGTATCPKASPPRMLRRRRWPRRSAA